MYDNVEPHESLKKSVTVALQYLSEFITSSRYICGDHLTIADLAILASVRGFFLHPIPQIAI